MFYFTFIVNCKEVQVKYCPTNDMIAYYMTKPLVGAKFNKFCKAIMKVSAVDQRVVLTMIGLASRSVLDKKILKIKVSIARLTLSQPNSEIIEISDSERSRKIIEISDSERSREITEISDSERS